MTIYRDRETGQYPISLADVRARSAVLFGDEPSEDILNDVGVDTVAETAPPEFDPQIQWLQEGEPELVAGKWRQTWTVSDIIEPVPESVARRQAKLQLSRVGLLDAVDELIASMPGQEGVEARIEWADAGHLRRDHPLILALGPQFDLTPQDIDALFIAASKIA